MKLKISTPAEIIYQGEVNNLSIPTENGTLHVAAGHAPVVASVKPGIIKIQVSLYDKPGNTILISTNKGMAFVDGKFVRIVSADATVNPQDSIEQLDAIRQSVIIKMKQMQNEGSIEEIERQRNKLEKIEADILLKRSLQK